MVKQVKPQWSDDLKCDWLAIRSIGNYRIAIDLPAGNCCDMTGAIEIAKSVCPLVSKVETYVGGVRDTAYSLHIRAGKLEWEAWDG